MEKSRRPALTRRVRNKSVDTVGAPIRGAGPTEGDAATAEATDPLNTRTAFGMGGRVPTAPPVKSKAKRIRVAMLHMLQRSQSF